MDLGVNCVYTKRFYHRDGSFFCDCFASCQAYILGIELCDTNLEEVLLQRKEMQLGCKIKIGKSFSGCNNCVGKRRCLAETSPA